MVQRLPQTSGAPALGAASLADSWEVVKLLIEQGIDVKSDAGGAALRRDRSLPRASAGIGHTQRPTFWISRSAAAFAAPKGDFRYILMECNEPEKCLRPYAGRESSAGSMACRCKSHPLHTASCQ